MPYLRNGIRGSLTYRSTTRSGHGRGVLLYSFPDAPHLMSDILHPKLLLEENEVINDLNNSMA